MRQMASAGELEKLVLDKRRGTIQSGVVVMSGEYKENLEEEEEKAVLYITCIVVVKEDLNTQGSTAVLKRCEAYVTL